MTLTERRFMRSVLDWPAMGKFTLFCAQVGLRTCVAARTRNRLIERGYIEPWSNWEEPPRPTEAGRAALDRLIRDSRARLAELRPH